MIRSPEHQAVIDEIDSRTAAILGMTLEEMRKRQADQEFKAAQSRKARTNTKQFTGHLYATKERGGFNDSPASLGVCLNIPREMKDENSYNIKTGILEQLNGKKVTVIIHD